MNPDLFYFYYTQSISPGLVATEFLASYSMFSEESIAAMPALNPDDIAAAVIYVLSNPPHVLVSDNKCTCIYKELLIK